MWKEAGLMCWRADMHFNSSDKLDLTANHRQQWPRTLRAAVCPTLQPGSASTTAHECVTLCLNALITVKVWNRSDCKHLFPPSVTCYPFSAGGSGERFSCPRADASTDCSTYLLRLNPRPATVATKTQDDGRRCRALAKSMGMKILTSNSSNRF